MMDFPDQPDITRTARPLGRLISRYFITTITKIIISRIGVEKIRNPPYYSTTSLSNLIYE